MNFRSGTFKRGDLISHRYNPEDICLITGTREAYDGTLFYDLKSIASGQLLTFNTVYVHKIYVWAA